MMDEDTRQAFAALSAQMSGIAGDARKGVELAHENRHEQAKMAYEVKSLRGDVDQLKTAVFGSAPPPPAHMAPVVARITHGEGDMAELAGQLLAVQADVASVKAINEEQTALLRKAFAGFIKQHPQVATAFVGFLMALLGFLTSYLSSKGHP